VNTLTIFTPTYNRGYLLPNLYESLIKQTNHDFCWLIIDDGSIDNTKQLVNKFQEERKINIIYIYQVNRGKHVAHNTALAMCHSELFFCVDSDDILTIDAIDTILKLNEEVKEDDILGFYFRKSTMNGKYSGENFPDNINRIGLMELYDRYRFTGEMAIILKTKKISTYRFPVFDDEKFISESVFYEKIDSIAPMVINKKVIYLFEYLDDGYSANAIRLSHDNPKGTAIAYLSSSIHYKSPYLKIKKMAQYYAWIKVMKLDKKKFDTKGILVVHKFVSLLLSVYYIRLFKRNLKTRTIK